MPDQKMHETLIKKAGQLLKIKQVRDIYENVLPYNEQFKPENDPIDKAFLVSEIILRLGEGPEIEKMAKASDRGPELNIPGSKTKVDLEEYSSKLLQETYKQLLETMA